MKVRKAIPKDFDELYKIGLSTPELKVSATENFMDADEFKGFITDNDCIFLVAEEGKRIAGFILAHAEWVYRPVQNKYACIVYLVVLPEFRHKGIASKLYSECVPKLKMLGATHVYGWANTESDGSIIDFFKKQGFKEGHRYMWMDNELK